MYICIYSSHAARLGVDLIGIAEFVDYPGMIPGTSLLDWATGEPNARYHALRLPLAATRAGGRLAATFTGFEGWPDNRVVAQGIAGDDGGKVIVLVNTWDAAIPLDLGEHAVRGTIETVDETSHRGATTSIEERVIMLAPHATAVVRLPDDAPGTAQER